MQKLSDLNPKVFPHGFEKGSYMLHPGQKLTVGGNSESSSSQAASSNTPSFSSSGPINKAESDHAQKNSGPPIMEKASKPERGEWTFWSSTPGWNPSKNEIGQQHMTQLQHIHHHQMKLELIIINYTINMQKRLKLYFKKIKIICLLIILFFTACHNNSSKINETYYSNGKVKDKFYKYNSYEIHDHYDSSGWLYEHSSFQNNMKNGRDIKYFSNGKISQTDSFSNNLQVGISSLYNLKGDLVRQTYFKKGVLYASLDSTTLAKKKFTDLVFIVEGLPDTVIRNKEYKVKFFILGQANTKGSIVLYHFSGKKLLDAVKNITGYSLNFTNDCEDTFSFKYNYKGSVGFIGMLEKQGIKNKEFAQTYVDRAYVK